MEAMLPTFAQYGIPGLILFIVMVAIIYLLKKQNDIVSSVIKNNDTQATTNIDKLVTKIDSLLIVMAGEHEVNKNTDKNIDLIYNKINNIEDKMVSIDIKIDDIRCNIKKDIN